MLSIATASLIARSVLHPSRTAAMFLLSQVPLELTVSHIALYCGLRLSNWPVISPALITVL